MGRRLRDKLSQVQPPRDQAAEAEWQIFLRERHAWRNLREKEYAASKRHTMTSDVAEGDLILSHQNRENKLSPTFEPEPYCVLEKNGSAVVIKNFTGQNKMRNAGHMKKFVDQGTEKGAAETELPTPSVTIDTAKEGVFVNRIQLLEFSKFPNTVFTSSAESSSRRAKESPSQEKGNP